MTALLAAILPFVLKIIVSLLSRQETVEVVEVQERISDAIVNAPRTKDEVLDRLGGGTF